jgi:hypothetical protein
MILHFRIVFRCVHFFSSELFPFLTFGLMVIYSFLSLFTVFVYIQNKFSSLLFSSVSDSCSFSGLVFHIVYFLKEVIFVLI